ncbi:molybdopterin synthase sulfur carrier subunit [Scopulibacillus darangshiensis]|uniref:Molybdopterin synthase sulfur carrier subunit n=1 Tax=Scopulibacillus darangshiensis TaxID=442528 RepID=A0A4V2SKF0_9BACL|nr:molybdopterin converting factor subunit 1 [Scopulibacillus darangshiensis]TCP19316.1 molybdopterin synthase sulfur carrier subunit [Scopulibacillus darangshiensis]
MIKVLFFAGIREALGIDQLELELEGIQTVRQLKEQILKEHQLPTLKQSMTAINESFVTDQEEIKEGDTVAFIPPVSGG